MANLQKIVKVTQAQYKVLASGGTVGDYDGLNPNYIYLVQDDGIDSLITRVTHSQLKNLRDNKQLVPGMKYCISNYKTTTKAYNTKAAEHDFCIVVEALSENVLSEDAKATWNNGDSYFMRQYLNKATWIAPLPATNEIEFRWLYQEGNDPNYEDNPHSGAAYIEELTTIENRDGIEVPAMFNADHVNWDEYYDCYYVYDGTMQIVKGKNELISVLYTINEDGEDSGNYQEGGYKPDDLFTTMDGEIRLDPIDPHFEDGITASDVEYCFTMYADDTEQYDSDDEYNSLTIQRLTTYTNPKSRKIVPAFYAIKKWILDEDYDDSGQPFRDQSGVDIGQIFVYDGIQTIDDAEYDRWLKVESVQHGGWWNPQLYVLTNRVVEFEEYEEVNVPILYKADNIDRFGIIGNTDYDDVFKYVGNFEFNGEEYSRWCKYNKTNWFYTGSHSSDAYYYERYYDDLLTQKIVEDNEFTITQDQLTAAVNQAVSTYDKWVEYYPNKPEWSTTWHLTDKLVDADIKMVPLARLDAWSLKYCIDNDKTRFSWADQEKGKGVIYYLKDEFGNEAPYDFKNILFTDEDNELEKCYTFNYYNVSAEKNFDASLTSDKNCYNNIIESYGVMSNDDTILQDLTRTIFVDATNCSNNHIGKNSTYNIFLGNGIKNNIFGERCSHNVLDVDCYNNYFGNNCNNNTFDYRCQNNTFGNSCSNISLARDCTKNTFGNHCSGNQLARSCYENVFGERCTSNTFAATCHNNTFGDACASNELGEGDYNNKFEGNNTTNKLEGSCYQNHFGLNANSNDIKYGSYNNSFGVAASSNKMGENCFGIVFGDACNSNIIGSTGSVANYAKNIIFDASCSTNKIVPSGNSNANNYFQNIHVCIGVNNKTVTIARGQANETEIKTASTKEIILA